MQHHQPYERRRPAVVALLGYPGMGKSTQATAIAAALGVPRLRLGRFVKEGGLAKTPVQMDHPRLWYEQLQAFAGTFVNGPIAESVRTNRWALMDGFPRSQPEVDALQAAASANDWAVTVLHLGLPNPAERAAFSLHRQRSRAVVLGRSVNDAWYHGKITLAEQYEMSAISRCRELGMRIVDIDPRQPLHLMHRTIRHAIRLDYERLPWDWTALWLLHEIAPNAFLVGGSFYRPFFNGTAGPMQEPWDIGVAVESDEAVAAVRERLMAKAPHQRWRVGNAVTFMSRRLGIEVHTVEEALQLSHNLIGLSGGVRIREDGSLHVVCGPDAEAHLRRGILQPSATANLHEAEAKAKLLARFYPGLAAPFIGHAPATVIPDWATIHGEVTAMEHGGKRIWSTLTAAETSLAEELQRFAAATEKRPVAPPVPRPAPLPTGPPWEAPDAEFREWLLDELRAPVPSASRNPILEQAFVAQFGVPQKPTHQGWPLHQHAATVLLLIETDHFPEHRRALRIAALYHDLGKKWNVRTPGAHGRIGIRRWRAYAPAWLTDEERALTAFLIRHHDLLGRLARGVKEPEYQGAVDPAYIRTMLQYGGASPTDSLALLLAINRADVGAVASLRWALPELDLAHRMVASGLPA